MCPTPLAGWCRGQTIHPAGLWMDELHGVIQTLRLPRRTRLRLNFSRDHVLNPTFPCPHLSPSLLRVLPLPSISGRSPHPRYCSWASGCEIPYNKSHLDFVGCNIVKEMREARWSRMVTPSSSPDKTQADPGRPCIECGVPHRLLRWPLRSSTFNSVLLCPLLVILKRNRTSILWVRSWSSGVD